MTTNEEQLTINAIRMLAVDAIETAKSGHPGLCLGAAPAMYTLFARHLNYNPKSPNSVNRDRFIMSAGHGSALLYSTLHFFGYDVTTGNMMSFRQLASKTPGHPEYGVTAGVETSTGPLGQGVANAVGFAMAENILSKTYNKEDATIVDHYTYALCGDGCMMEGIEYEAASLAGTLKLGKLIVLYDSNNITIEGDTNGAFTEDVGARHAAQGWQVLTVNDGTDVDAISAAITLAKSEKDKPSLIVIKTVIGYGSPLAGSAKCHGAPLGKDNYDATKKALNWKSKPFEYPQEVTKHIAETVAPRLAKFESDNNKRTKDYRNKYADEYAAYTAQLKNKVEIENSDFKGLGKKDEATRFSSETVLNVIAKKNPCVYGGSADLGPSNMTVLKDGGYLSGDKHGRNIHFGIREHAMGAICNGMYLHGGVMPYCSTFLVFSDYMKHAIRMSALMRIPVTYVFTHDSIGVGEDGPTHQPIEQLTTLRSIPNLKVFRPADARETRAAYVSAFTGKSPTAVVLSRQTVPQLKGTSDDAMCGGYIVEDCNGDVPDVILIGSGSELQLAIAAKAELANDGIDARVVSMPSMDMFDYQPAKYREMILPSVVRARVCVEAAHSMPWYKYIGMDGEAVCIDTFGQSAPASQLYDAYKITVDSVVKAAKKSIKNVAKSMQNQTAQNDGGNEE